MANNDFIRKNLLEKVADLHSVPDGAYNIRENGKGTGRRSTDEIKIENKEGVPGIVVTVADGTIRKSVHIPVVITDSGINETVHNDFLVGKKQLKQILEKVINTHGATRAYRCGMRNPQLR